MTENIPISHPKCLHSIWVPKLNLKSPNLTKTTQSSQLRIDSKPLSFGDCLSCADNLCWTKIHGSTKARQVFYMLVNFTVSRTNFSSSAGFQWQWRQMPAGHRSAYGARQIYNSLGAFCGWVVLSITHHLSLPSLHKLLCSNCCMQLCFYKIHSQRGGWNLAKLNIGFAAQFSWVGLIDRRDFSQPYGCLAAFPRGFLIRLLQPLLICYSQPFSILTATFSCIFTFSRLSWLLQCQNTYNFFFNLCLSLYICMD